MIDEQVLERMLHDEADTYAVPADGPDEVLEAAATDEDRRPRRAWWLTAAAAVVVLVAGGVAIGQGGIPSLPSRTEAGPEPLYDETGTKRQPTFAGYDDDGGANWAVGGGNETSDSSGGGSGGGGAAPDQADAAHVVRTGETWLEVPERRVPDVLRDVVRIAGAHGGYVAESDAETAGDSPSGQVTIRVPVKAFDRAIQDVAALGEVEQSTTRAEDVSDQVADVEARLRSATATRAQLRTLLARANTVGEVLAVQSRLDDVQTEIERLQGRQESLKDRTSYGTLRVHVSPPGSDTEPEDGFGKAWHDAVNGFVGGFEGLVAASGTMAFALIVAVALFFLARRAYRFWVRGVV